MFMAEGAEVKIKSLKKMMDVLNCFIEKQPLGVTEISEKLGLYKSNVHNILSTMVSMDYLEQDKISGKYYLGIGVVRLSRAVGNRFSFHNAALYHMQAISHELGEIVYLSVPMKRMIYYLDAIFPESVYYLNYSGRFVSNYRDSTEMMHCTASGKAMLATMCKADQEEYLSKPLDACTPHSITDPDVLRLQLQKIREQGYAVDDEEAEEGLRCIAVPIRSQEGGLLGAISISGPKERMTADILPKYSEMLKAHVHDIEHGI